MRRAASSGDSSAILAQLDADDADEARAKALLASHTDKDWTYAVIPSADGRRRS